MSEGASISVQDIISCGALTKAQEKRLKELDTNKDGMLDAEEIFELIQNEHHKSKLKGRMRNLMILMFISCVVLVCAICGITYGVVANVNQLDVNESTKVVESRQDGSILAGDSASLVIPLEELSDLASPWSVDRLFFSGRTTEEYGSILVSGVQKLDDEIRFEAWNGLIVTVKDGVATTYQNDTSLSGRRLLNIFDDVWDKVKGTVDTVKDAFDETFKKLFGKSFLDVWMEITIQNMDAGKETADVLVIPVVKAVNPKLGNCLDNPYDNFLDCFTVAPCFDYMRKVVEEWSKQCGNDGGCLMLDAKGEFSSDRFLSMARGLVSPLEKCARTGNPEGCKDFGNCLTGGMKMYNRFAP